MSKLCFLVPTKKGVNIFHVGKLINVAVRRRETFYEDFIFLDKFGLDGIFLRNQNSQLRIIP